MWNELKAAAKLWLAAKIRDLLAPPPVVPAPRVRHTGEVSMQKYEADLPVAGAKDVTKRHLHVEIDGTDTVTDLAADATVGAFAVEDGKAFKVWLIDEDDASNLSPFDEASVYSATATDDIPPPNPGMLGVRHVGEE